MSGQREDLSNEFREMSDEELLERWRSGNLTEIAAEKNSTIIFPVPIDIFAAFVDMANSVSKKKE